MYLQAMKYSVIFIAPIVIYLAGYHMGGVDKEQKQTVAIAKQTQKIQELQYKLADQQKPVDIQVNANAKIEEVKRNANTTDDVTISAKWMCYYADKICPTTLSK